MIKPFRPLKYHKTIHNYEWLYTKYVIENLNSRQVAAIAGCDHTIVCNALRRVGIPTKQKVAKDPYIRSKICEECGKEFAVGGSGNPPRTQKLCSSRCASTRANRRDVYKGSNAPRPRKCKTTLHNEEWLREHYLNQKFSMSEIGIICGCSSDAVSWALEKFQIQVRSCKEAQQFETTWRNSVKRDKVLKLKKELEDRGERGQARDLFTANFSATLRATYGMTVAEYETMYNDQNGVCAICRKPETRKNPATRKACNLAVDHDHATGKVRELLCSHCNTSLGHLKEDIVVFKNAITYLQKHSSKSVIPKKTPLKEYWDSSILLNI